MPCGSDLILADNAYIGEGTVLFSIVQTVADDELVGDDLAYVFGGEVYFSALGLVKQSYGADASCALIEKIGDQVFKSSSAVDYILDYDDVLVRQVGTVEVEDYVYVS